MTNDKATPRPWKIEHCKEALASYGIKDANGNVFQCSWTTPCPIEEAKANAELIVKAVNSHDALLCACNMAKHFLKAYKDGKANKSWVAVDEILEAIAKAEGE